MKHPEQPRERRSGFTLTEMIVTVGIIGILTPVMFTLLASGTGLFARNVVVNMAHQQAQAGVMRVARDVRQSVSIPQLVDANLQTVASPGPAAGVTFQVVAKGPFNVKNDPTAPQIIMLEAPNPKPAAPEVGDRLIVVDYNVEADITRITAQGQGSNHWNVSLKDGSQTRVQTKNDSFVVCYITRRVGYVVKDGELRYYPNLTATPDTYHVVSRNITSPTPFKVPPNETGTPDTRYTSVTISALDPTYSNRKYRSTSMQLVDARVPYRCQLTKYQ